MRVGKFFAFLGLWLLLPVIGGAVVYFVVLPRLASKPAAQVEEPVPSVDGTTTYGHPVIQVSARKAAIVPSGRFETGFSGGRKKKPKPTTPVTTPTGEAAKPTEPLQKAPEPVTTPPSQETIPVPESGGDGSTSN